MQADSDHTYLGIVNPGPTLCESDISSVEASFGFALPTEYRDFLLRSNGGEFADHVSIQTLVEVPRGMGGFRFFRRIYPEGPASGFRLGQDSFGIQIYDQELDEDDIAEGYVKHLPDETLIIASDQCGLILLVAAGPKKGWVYYYDSGAFGSGVPWLYLISESFNDFLARIRVQPRTDWRTELPLFRLIEGNDIREFQELVVRQPSVLDEFDELGHSLLTATVFFNRPHFLGWLIERGLFLSATDKEGETAASTAVIYGHTSCLKLLLDAGISPNDRTAHGSPLLTRSTSTYGMQIDLTLLLLSRGADVGIIDDQGDTVLSACRRDPYKEWVPFFVSQGADTEYAVRRCVDRLEQELPKWEVLGCARTIAQLAHDEIWKQSPKAIDALQELGREGTIYGVFATRKLRTIGMKDDDD